MSGGVYTGDMAEVEEACGTEVADALAEVLGGIHVYVPREPCDDSPLAKLEDAHVEALIASFAQSMIYVSRRRARPEPTDPRKVVALLDEGLTVKQVAVKLQITDVHVYRIVRKARAALPSARALPGQLSLFDDGV